MIEFFKELILKDFWLKLFSFALAVLVWFTVNVAVQKEASPDTPLALSTIEQRTFSNLPVVVLSSAEDARTFKIQPREVEVTVQGDARRVKNLSIKDIQVLVDLTGVQAAHDFKKNIDLSLPAGVSRVRVDPDHVQVIYPPGN